jgi:DKNYY family
MAFLNWLVIVLLVFWPLIFVTSMMGLGGPEATNDKSAVLTTLLILLYPAVIFFVYSLFNVNFFIWSGGKAFVVSAITLIAVLFLTGYLTLYVNLIRGILNEGYSVAGGSVYYDAVKQANMDGESFKIFPDVFGRANGYALDAKSVYYRGESMMNADAQTFEFIGYTSEEGMGTRFDAQDAQSLFFDGELVGSK